MVSIHDLALGVAGRRLVLLKHALKLGIIAHTYALNVLREGQKQSETASVNRATPRHTIRPHDSGPQAIYNEMYLTARLGEVRNNDWFANRHRNAMWARQRHQPPPVRKVWIAKANLFDRPVLHGRVVDIVEQLVLAKRKDGHKRRAVLNGETNETLVPLDECNVLAAAVRGRP